MKIKASKNITEIIPADKRQGKHSNFTETLDLILGKNRFDIVSRKTFNLNARQQEGNKKWTPLLWLCSVFLVAISAMFFSVNLIDSGFALIVAIALFTYGWRLKKKPSTEDYNKLMEGAHDPEIARIILDWVTKLSSSSISLFQMVRDKINKIPSEHLKAPNITMVLLGDDSHRQALGINKRIPDTPFLYRTSDIEQIFQPLVKALSETEKYTHFKIDIKAEKETKVSEPVIQASPVDLTKTDSTKPIEHDTSKPKKRVNPPRVYQYSQTALDDEIYCRNIVEAMKTPEFHDSKIKGKGKRKLWYAALKQIDEDPKAWKAYKDNPNSDETKVFKEKLFGKNCLNESDPSKQYEFRTGQNHYLNAFIESTGVKLPEEQKPKESKTK